MSARRRNNQRIKRERREKAEEDRRKMMEWSRNFHGMQVFALMIREAVNMKTGGNQARAEFYDALQRMDIEVFDTTLELFEYYFNREQKRVDENGGDWTQFSSTIAANGLGNDWHEPVWEALNYTREMRADEVRIEKSILQRLAETPAHIRRDSILHQALFEPERLIPNMEAAT